MTYYHVLELECQNLDQDILIAHLSELAFESFEYTTKGIKAFIPSQAYNQKLVLQSVSLLSQFPCSFKWKELKEQNWNQIWESDYKRVEVGNFCLIRATFHKPQAGFDHELIIKPEMAFGTGHHETTFMMVEIMSEMNFNKKKVLDFGAGTGVLAILTSKLGANHIDAVDNDPNALRSIGENSQLNDVSGIYVHNSIENIVQNNRYDIILANINKNVLKNYVERLSKIINPGGELILSGLLSHDRDEMVELYKKSFFALMSEQNRGEWICLRFNKLD